MLLLGLIEVPGWLLLLLGILLITYIISKFREQNVFEAQGIKGPPRYPLLGTTLGVFTEGPRDGDLRSYREYGKVHRLVESGQNVLVAGDEEMMREVMVKEFSTFTNRRSFGIADPIASKMLNMLNDEPWKRVRSLLTPTFSALKLKMMAKSINECGDLLVNNLDEYCKKDEAFNAKDVCGTFTMDVIARTGFGLQVDSQKDKDNDFVKMGRKAMDLSITNIAVIVAFLCPRLGPLIDKLGLSFFGKDVIGFFTGVLEQTMKRRKEGSKGQKDFLQLMMDAHVGQDDVKKGKESDQTKVDQTKGLSQEEMLAQGFVFFMAGFDTVSSGLALLLYNLARYPEAQEKAYQEIIDKLGDEGDIEYSEVGNLTYLEMCLDESLRIYPPESRVDRVAKRDVVIKGVRIPKDSIVMIPIQSIHLDPEIYPEPYEFKPERFTAEQKAKRSPYHWMPFGYGPRGCIGMRLAILEIKMAAVQVLRKFRFVTCEKTQYPLKFAKTGNLASDGLCLKVEQRN